jgi:hypothetical protein
MNTSASGGSNSTLGFLLVEHFHLDLRNARSDQALLARRKASWLQGENEEVYYAPDGVASQTKLSSNGRCPVYAAMLTMSIGRKTRKPVAAARPTPRTIDIGKSKFSMEPLQSRCN